jgi:hypothetical protein
MRVKFSQTLNVFHFFDENAFFSCFYFYCLHSVHIEITFHLIFVPKYFFKTVIFRFLKFTFDSCVLENSKIIVGNRRGEIKEQGDCTIYVVTCICVYNNCRI